MKKITVKNKENKIVGSVELNMQTEELTDLWVDPEYRRHGIAKILILQAQVQAHFHGLKRVFATTHLTNTPTQKLFEKLGFRTLLKYEKKL